MRQVSIKMVKSGDILGTSILSDKGRVLVNRGLVLSDKIIRRLGELGISMVVIDDEASKDVVLEEVISFERRREAMMALEESGEAAKSGREMDIARLKDVVSGIVDDILFEKHIILSLMDIRSYDTQMFAHAVNVCILSVVLGKALGLNKDDLNVLAVGSTLHDIGTIKLPQSLLRKREPFTPTEQSLYQTHTEEGFQILRSRSEIHLVSAHIAFQHHEALDGSGYPRGLIGNKIHFMAQIVALADLYDSLVNEGPGHSRKHPYEAVEILMGSAGNLFSFDLVKAFLDHIAVYPTGSTVELSTGEIGIVISQNRSLPTRPVVRVFRGPSINSNMTLDLVEHLTIFITRVIS